MSPRHPPFKPITDDGQVPSTKVDNLSQNPSDTSDAAASLPDQSQVENKTQNDGQHTSASSPSTTSSSEQQTSVFWPTKVSTDKTVKIDEGVYEITNVKSHYAMDVAGGSVFNNANVQLYNANGSLAQIWNSNKTLAQKWQVQLDDQGRVTFKNAIQDVFFPMLAVSFRV